MKKLGLVVLVVLLVFSVGCKKEKTLYDKDGYVNIELWYGAAMTEAGHPPSDWHVLDIIKEELGINLKLSALASGETEQDVQINSASASNTLPDLFMVRRNPFVALVHDEMLAPVDELYNLMPNRTRLQYNEDSRRFTTINGRSYGFASPGAIEKNEGVLIRKDWLDRLGLDVPVTLEDYMNVMIAFTRRDPDGNGRHDTYGFGAFVEINNFEEGLGRRFDPIFGAFGVAGTWDLSGPNPGLNVRKPEYFDALSFVKRMIDERVIDPNWTSYTKDDFRYAWKQGRFGIMREQNAAFAAENNYSPFDRNFPNGEWIVIDPPRGPNGHQSVGVYTQAYRIYAMSIDAYEIGKGPYIAKLLEWMSSDRGYFLLGWGEEGVNYVLDENGVPTVDGIPDPTKGFSRQEASPLTQLRNMVFYNSEIELLARFPTYRAPVSGRRMSALDVLRDMQSRPWTPNIGADALPAPSGDLERFYRQGVIEFINGSRQLTRTAWNAWVAEFDRLGGREWEREGIEFARVNGYLR
ncbi:MAG: ABC transporter substrate-binding protein [Treponema sp.]|nr:ABC transporter substrate-binding protein [Treponema sp.]